jgi:hypothetical protein
MKTTILKFSALLLLFSLIGAGCEKEEDLFELQIGDKDATLIKEVNGIEFKFCLLNEQGEPATVFNEGENFTFQFSITNFKKDSIIITTEFINDEFFRVYRMTGDSKSDMGKPWTGVWCYYSGEPKEFILQSSKIKSLQCPWVLTVKEKPDYPLCVSESKDYLGRGEYFTSFNLNFHYIFNNESVIIKEKEFKINFKIN